jgi:hypothetical protein
MFFCRGYLCVLHGSQNKQCFFLYERLIYMFYNGYGMCSLRGSD